MEHDHITRLPQPAEGISSAEYFKKRYSGPFGEIKRKHDRAIYATSHVFNNSALWYKYYGDTAQDDPFVKDFTQLVALCQGLLEQNASLRYQLESEGIIPLEDDEEPK